MVSDPATLAVYKHGIDGLKYVSSSFQLSACVYSKCDMMWNTAKG